MSIHLLHESEILICLGFPLRFPWVNRGSQRIRYAYFKRSKIIGTGSKLSCKGRETEDSEAKPTERDLSEGNRRSDGKRVFLREVQSTLLRT